MLQIDLASDVEARLKAEAEARGVSISEYVRQLIEGPQPAQARTEVERQAALRRIFGAYAGEGTTVDQFLQTKHAEAEHENERYDRWLRG